MTLLSRLRAAYSCWPLDVTLLREAADRLEEMHDAALVIAQYTSDAWAREQLENIFKHPLDTPETRDY
jgi:hypothetical protein